MGSLNAQKFARKVSESVRNNKSATYEKLMIEAGYKPTTAKKPYRVLRTEGFQKALALENRPLLEGIHQQINRFKDAIAKKDLNNEELRTLVGSTDIFIKNYQLLSGGATERQVFVVPGEVVQRNEIVAKPPEVLPPNGSIEPQK